MDFLVEKNWFGYFFQEGTIGDEFIIKPVPGRFADQLSNFTITNSSRIFKDPDFLNISHHIIYKQLKFRADDMRSSELLNTFA